MRVSQARFQDWLKRLTGAKGTAQLAEVSETASPVINLTDPPPEFQMFAGDKLAGGAVQFTGVATNAVIGLYNTQSNLLVVVESVIIGNPSAAALRVGIQLIDGITPGADQTTLKEWRDARNSLQSLSGNDFPQAVLANSSEALAGFDFLDITLPVNGTIEWAHPVVLDNGRALRVTCATAAVALSASFVWRERLVDREELTR